MTNYMSCPTTSTLTGPIIPITVRMKYKCGSHPRKVEVKVSQVARRKNKNVSHSEIERETSLIDAELAPLELGHRQNDAEPLVLEISVCPGAGTDIEHKTCKRVGRRRGPERERFCKDADLVVFFWEVTFKLKNKEIKLAAE